ncbi:MAG: hypothetical protein IME96_13415 [Proteobacteria bacterium]|nr:hypothetical protein [Pseudomonadota bacterium]
MKKSLSLILAIVMAYLMSQPASAMEVAPSMRARMILPCLKNRPVWPVPILFMKIHYWRWSFKHPFLTFYTNLPF